MIPFNTSALADALCRGGNDDGGWGYHAGKASRIEPTCWVALYLSRTGQSTRDLTDRTATWLTSRQRADGFLDDTSGEPPNLGFNGLAALAGRSAGTLRSEHAARLLGALSRARGVAAKSDVNRQDNSLRGWSWIDGTFSWVEPTAWCLLALKKFPDTLPSGERAARIDEAERLLLDRMCLTGGWNYGNSNMLGKELHAYVPTTALALLALQDRRDDPQVQRSREFLTSQRLSEPSGMALSLTSICLRVYGVPASDVDERLSSLAEKHALFNNLHISAMAAYSLTAASHDVQDFRL